MSDIGAGVKMRSTCMRQLSCSLWRHTTIDLYGKVLVVVPQCPYPSHGLLDELLMLLAGMDAEKQDVPDVRDERYDLPQRRLRIYCKDGMHTFAPYLFREQDALIA